MPEPFLTLAEMCVKYHVSDRRARDIIRQHNIPILQPGRQFLFDEQAEIAFRESTRRNVERILPDAPTCRAEAKAPRGARAERAYERVSRLLEDKVTRQTAAPAARARRRAAPK